MLLNAFTLFLLLNTQNQKNAPDFVVQYHAVSTKKEELKYIEDFKNNINVDVKAYVISLQMKQAKYKTFPWSKLAVFNREKKKLNQLINQHPKNVHLRYIRLVLQENTPKILGYQTNLKEDKSFLKSVLKIKDTTDYLDSYILKNTSL